MNSFTAKLYHKEQKQFTTFCSHCLTQGHHLSLCTNDTVCRECTETRHKRRDADCNLWQNSKEKPSEPDKDSRGASTGGKSKGGSEKSVDRKKKDDRGRTSGWQTMLRSMMDLHSMRSRSETQSARDLDRSPAPTPWKCRNRRGVTMGRTCATLHPTARRLPMQSATDSGKHAQLFTPQPDNYRCRVQLTGVGLTGCSPLLDLVYRLGFV